MVRCASLNMLGGGVGLGRALYGEGAPGLGLEGKSVTNYIMGSDHIGT